MKRIIMFLIGAVLSGLIINLPASGAEIITRKVAGTKEELVYDILELVLSKTMPDASLIQASEVLNGARLREEVKQGNIDVMWTGASPENDRQLLTIRIPVLKGLLGHRIFIIRKGEQFRFDNISTLNDLKQLNAGQGTFWGDNKVLGAANVPVITTIKYANLLPMLDGERFDYFPRAVHEPWSEVASRPEMNLTVEKKLMLIYPNAMYFFVNKNNHKLHEKIFTGFEMAIKDGSFDDLFFNHPMIKDVLAKANLKQRTVLRIDNPYLHPDTPTGRSEFWLDITKL
ncbi:diguanylate cyclase [Photobacterium sagamiensis]|uniref:diguanylate cyclase n=1 Tax=Photobacterium sagamiensis TaxID=2910241 RepID=UPI003D09E4AF